MKYDDYQVFLLNKVSKYIEKKEREGIDTSLSTLSYFNSWTNDPGLHKLKIWVHGYKELYNYLKYFFRNTLSTAKYSNFQLCNQFKEYKSKTIILSFGTKSSFQKDGSFTDRLLNINSKQNKNILWFLVSSDNYVPKNLKSNICILIRKKQNIFYYFIFFIKTVFKLLINVRFNIFKFLHEIPCDSIFANIVSKNFINILKNNNIKTVFMPYEGQPFHNKVSLDTKSFNSKIFIVGYHCSIPPLPTNMVYRKGAPDKLIISGNDQYFYLTKFLRWNKKKLSILPSVRFKKVTPETLSGYIYIPYVIFDETKILNLFKDILELNNINYYFEPRNHPLCFNSELHKNLIKKIEKIYKQKNINHNQKPKNISIYIGATSAVLESLENDIDVYHICSDPIFQAYSSKIWPNIQVEKINDYIFHYKLVNKSSTIIFSKDNNIFDKNYINE